jgi:hypothetical protein
MPVSDAGDTSEKIVGEETSGTSAKAKSQNSKLTTFEF